MLISPSFSHHIVAVSLPILGQHEECTLAHPPSEPSLVRCSAAHPPLGQMPSDTCIPKKKKKKKSLYVGNNLCNQYWLNIYSRYIFRLFCFKLQSYIWNSGIFSGGNVSEVSRNLQAEKYMSNSAWEKFTGPFRSRAPRTTLASLRR